VYSATYDKKGAGDEPEVKSIAYNLVTYSDTVEDYSKYISFNKLLSIGIQ